MEFITFQSAVSPELNAARKKLCKDLNMSRHQWFELATLALMELYGRHYDGEVDPAVALQLKKLMEV